jgi:hypothetical protein
MVELQPQAAPQQQAPPRRRRNPKKPLFWRAAAMTRGEARIGSSKRVGGRKLGKHIARIGPVVMSFSLIRPSLLQRYAMWLSNGVNCCQLA